MSRLFGRLADAHTDLRLHYEIRPKLSRPQLRELRRGGLVSVQPGIESFSTNVLTAMRKNVTGMGNLELLKWTTYYGMNNLYNVLYGFPGETVDDYRGQADLGTQDQPPAAAVTQSPGPGPTAGHQCSSIPTNMRCTARRAVTVLPAHLSARPRPRSGVGF